MPKAAKKPRIAISLPNDILQTVLKAAETNGLSTSLVIEAVLRTHFNQPEPIHKIS